MIVFRFSACVSKSVSVCGFVCVCACLCTGIQTLSYRVNYVVTLNAICTCAHYSIVLFCFKCIVFFFL